MKNQHLKQPPNDTDVWILAGQSNMEGVGELAYALPPSEDVYSFTSAGNWEIAAEPLHRFWESFTPVHQLLIRPGLPEHRRHMTDAQLAELETVERKYGAGLGMSFGKTLASLTHRHIGLIPCAHGGTSLAQWNPDLKSQGGASLYGAMLERINRCGRKPKGLLWYQGESEGWSIESGQKWGADFETWIARLRADLDQPHFPVLVVQIGRTTIDTAVVRAWNAVQLGQYALRDRVDHVAMTSAIDLPLVDCIHLNAAGLKRLGNRLARMAAALISGTPGNQIGPRLKRAIQRPEPPDRVLIDLSFTGVTGAWQPADHIAGFDVMDADGNPHRINHVINAFRNPADPTSILVRLNIALQPGETVTYGHGLRPYCNAVDEADFPLCASTITLEPTTGATGTEKGQTL